MVEHSIETGGTTTLDQQDNYLQRQPQSQRLSSRSVVTPSNMTQSATDQEEIYDSVRSLSLAQDDSLNYKREKARKMQARLSREFEEEEKGSPSSPEDVDDLGEQSFEEEEEEEKKEEGGRMSALQMMLQASENFIKRQESTNSQEKVKPGQDDYLGYGLPQVHALDSSHHDDTDDDVELKRQQNYNSFKYEPSQSCSSSQQNGYGTPIVEDAENSLESIEKVSEQSFERFQASNLQGNTSYTNSLSSRQHQHHQKHRTPPSLLETETVNEVALSFKRQQYSDLTVMKNPSFITVMGQADSRSPSVQRQQIQGGGGGVHGYTSKMPSDSLNDISGENEPSSIANPTDNSSIDASSYATPVIVASQQKQEIMSPHILLTKQDETSSPNSFKLNQSTEKAQDSVLVYDEVGENADRLNQLVFGVGQGTDLYNANFQLDGGQITTIRQSLDTSKEQVMAEFNSGPRRITSSDSASNDSSNPLQVSAAQMSTAQLSTAQMQGNTSLENSAQSPSIDQRGDGSIRSESIKVLHFERSDHIDSLVDLSIDKMMADDCPLTDSKLFVAENKFHQICSNSEARDTKLNQRLLLLSAGVGCSSFNQASSLTNSLKKKSDSGAMMSSEMRTRTFTDVLNAMRDTDEIEEEKRQIIRMREVSPQQQQEDTSSHSHLSQSAQMLTARKQSAADESNTVVGFVTEEEDCQGFNFPLNLHSIEQELQQTANQFHPVRKQAVSVSQAEVLTDSLNTKSEDKKFHSNSIDEDLHQSRSPSFYKMNTSGDNEFLDGEVRSSGVSDLNRDEFASNLMPSSLSFASGAAAQIAYTDQMSQQNPYHHQRLTSSNPGNKNNSSSHYRGESFGNCLPLTSGHTSSQRDSISNGKTEEESPHKPLKTSSIIKLQEVSGLHQQISELHSDAEDSANDGCGNVVMDNTNQGDDDDSRVEERVMLIEDDTASVKSSEKGPPQQLLQHKSNEDGEDRLVSSGLSKTDSLRDLKVFFSREQQQQPRATDESKSSDECQNQAELGFDQQEPACVNQTIAEENLEESSPERQTRRTSLLKISKKTSESRRDSVEIELLKHLIQREGRESQKLVLVQNKLVPQQECTEKRISLQQESRSNTAMRNLLKLEDFSITDESEVLVGNGPPASVNQSDYSHLKNLLDKFQKSPKQNSSCEIEEVGILRSQVTSLQEQITRLKDDLQRAQANAQTLEVEKGKAMARVDRLEAKSQIAEEQLNNEQQSSRHFSNKYKMLKQEFRKMKQKYQSELTTCVEEMENLRVIVTDVVSIQSQSEHKKLLSASRRTHQRENNIDSSQPGGISILKSSTGESAITPMPIVQDHVQSQKVLGLRSSLRKRSIKTHPEETTSSESPVRPVGIAPLVKQTALRRSGRFSSHEQFSLNSSQAQTARFSVDFTKSARVVSEYADIMSTGYMQQTQRKDSASSSHNSKQILIRTFEGSDRSTSLGRRSKASKVSQKKHKNATIKECSEEDFSSVLKTNRRTIDLVKSTILNDGMAQQTRAKQRKQQTQTLQTMLTNLYQRSRKPATPTPQTQPTLNIVKQKLAEENVVFQQEDLHHRSPLHHQNNHQQKSKKQQTIVITKYTP